MYPTITIIKKIGNLKEEKDELKFNCFIPEMKVNYNYYNR